MNRSRISALLAGIALFGVAAAITSAQSQSRSGPDPAIALSQQVWALQTLHDLDLDPPQLESLRAAIPKLADDPTPHTRNRVPARYLAALEALRQALIHDKDNADASDQIDELRDDLESIREDEQVDLDDHVRIVDAARAAVPDMMKSLRPSQLSGYLVAYQDETPDPVQSLARAADESRGLDDVKFNALSERTARDVAILLAGLDAEKAAPVAERVRQWLSQTRALSNNDFKAGQADREKSAKTALGEFDSFDVLRHWIERDVAELLSNPQLSAVIEERTRQAGK